MNEPRKEARRERHNLANTLLLINHLQEHAGGCEGVKRIWSETESARGYGFLAEMTDGSHVDVMVEVYEP